jgi:8-oxo-dGTP pyrophosphatase MutT (NUDIX family)
MYEIYINDTPLFLVNTAEGKRRNRDNQHLVDLYRHRKSLFQYIDALEKNNEYASVTIYADDVEALKTDFFSIYHLVPAAGGVVFNADNELLMIFRRGSWDLPKGKIDAGESVEAAAVREVQEEVGLQEVRITRPICTTYHTYKDGKGRRCLKPTFWFEMRTNETQVTLQTEEDIEDSRWTQAAEMLQSSVPIYASIKRVLEQL